MSIFQIPETSIHHRDDYIVSKVEGLYHIIPFHLLRATDKVDFQVVPFFEVVNGIDRVNHEPGAHSPSFAGDTDVWYMHPGQGDNLVVFSGSRFVELYTPDHGKVEVFEVSADWIKQDGKIIHDGPAMLGWPIGVFHRNYSPEGSTSLNFAVRYDNFDIDTEFNIYKVDTKT
ncbi:MAG: hypothetical protein H6767_08055 [Candidatus Peribacteria bacterium]|nr:MAG: hypothetical protein H6767_08055 [Candidatus Peribacteria bacterium]